MWILPVLGIVALLALSWKDTAVTPSTSALTPIQRVRLAKAALETLKTYPNNVQWVMLESCAEGLGMTTLAESARKKSGIKADDVAKLKRIAQGGMA